ncbi:MAG TPA: translation initiation factor IF-2 [Dehalococcoidia bacterium]
MTTRSSGGARPDARAPRGASFSGSQAPKTEGPRELTLPRAITVKDLADRMGMSPVEVIKDLMKNGVMATINQTIDFDTAAIIASDFGFEVQEAAPAPVEAPEQPVERIKAAVTEEEDASKLRPRPPVVTIMGHVDHGKTSILDAIRASRVTESEAGGITQHIGAYQVSVNQQQITFLDTPGHEAFTAMRARGAQVTDIAVLVVAADDGVMPQTVEAINHAKAAGVPIIVAINKMDLAQANPDRVKQQLSEQGLIPEDWGGDTIMVPVSARTGDGLNDLLENILLVAELQELRANPDRPAAGVVVEAGLEASRGPVATVLVQTGTLRTGDVVMVGDTWGRVRAMFNHLGQRIQEAGPSVPAKILGLQAVPLAGDVLTVAESERQARLAVEQRQRQKEAEAFQTQRSVSLDTLFGEISAGKVKELNIILKTDVQGSLEAIKGALERLSTDEVRVKVIHAATGTITEWDVMLAVASKGIVIGFNVRPETGARRLADAEGVDIRFYDVIYNVVDDVSKALKGMLEPRYREVVEGHAEVRQVFRVSRRNAIAGSYVRDGVITRNATARVIRNDEVIHTGRVSSLRRFQEDVREVQAGYECGITIEDFDSFEEGDVIETYRREREQV